MDISKCQCFTHQCMPLLLFVIMSTIVFVVYRVTAHSSFPLLKVKGTVVDYPENEKFVFKENSRKL